jgi:hypothetical protein
LRTTALFRLAWYPFRARTFITGYTCEHNNNSIQFFIIYVLGQQLQGQLQTQHIVDTIIT